MKKVVNFIKDYWITALICVGFVLLYKYISDHKLFIALMFTPLKGILESFVEDRDVTVLNLVSSIKLLIPSVAITLAIALGLGVLVGMNSKLRKILHPIIYAFSCVPSILLSPFVVLLSPTFWWASVILIVYGTSHGLGFYVKRYSTLGLYQKVWGGFIFMVLVLVVVMTFFEKIKNRMLKWTIN